MSMRGRAARMLEVAASYLQARAAIASGSAAVAIVETCTYSACSCPAGKITAKQTDEGCATAACVEGSGFSPCLPHQLTASG